jgi:Protein of unknown function (DUF1580)
MQASSPTQLLTETILTLAAAARRLPGHRDGTHCNPSTIWRWGRKGAKSPGGQRIYLEMARMGGKWVTSLEAMQRFCDALTPAPDETATPSPATPTTKQIAKRADRAGRDLERMGV